MVRMYAPGFGDPLQPCSEQRTSAIRVQLAVARVQQTARGSIQFFNATIGSTSPTKTSWRYEPGGWPPPAPAANRLTYSSVSSTANPSTPSLPLCIAAISPALSNSTPGERVDLGDSSFFHELKRRRVFRVAAFYAAIAWVVLQVTSTLGDLVALPEWVGRLVLVLVLTGFPIALVLAWIYELTPSGIRRTDDTLASASRNRRITYVAGFAGIMAGVALLAAVSKWLVFTPPKAGQPFASVPSEATSIAVMPFAALANDSTYFADGLTEELIAAVGRIPGLRVISRTSAFAYRDSELTVRQIADSLRVGTVLEGSVRREGDRLRVTARLVDVATDAALWDRTFDRELRDVFALQDEIAKAVAGALRLRFSSSRSMSADVEAYDLYLRGLAEWNQRTPPALQRAAAHFQSAIARDSSYAAAYVGLSDALLLSALLGAADPAEMRARAIEAAQRALQIDSTSSGAHASLGHVLFNFDHDYASGERHLLRALQLDSSYASARLYLGIMYNDMGQFPRAIAVLQQAMERDPRSAPIRTTLARVYMSADRPAEALEQLQISHALNPTWTFTQAMLGHVLVEQGKANEALPLVQRAAARGGLVDSLHLVYMLGRAGQRQEGQRLLNQLVRGRRDTFGLPSQFAMAYFGLNDREEAFRWLDRQARTFGSPSYLRLPLWAPVRSDPRFIRVLRELGVGP